MIRIFHNSAAPGADCKFRLLPDFQLLHHRIRQFKGQLCLQAGDFHSILIALPQRLHDDRPQLQEAGVLPFDSLADTDQILCSPDSQFLVQQIVKQGSLFSSVQNMAHILQGL